MEARYRLHMSAPHGHDHGHGGPHLHAAANSSLRSLTIALVLNAAYTLVEVIAAPAFRLDSDGRLAVPTGPGLGVELDREKLRRFEAEGHASETWTWDERGEFEAR